MAKRVLVGLGAFLLVVALAGCGKFFPRQNNSSGGSTGGGTTASTDRLYVANAASNLNSIAGFTLSKSGLATISAAGYSVPLAPSTITITPNNSWAYVGSLGGAIYAYSVSNSGALTLANSNTAVATAVSPQALCVDSTGKWLLNIDALTGYAYSYSINTSTGALTAASGSPAQLASTTAQAMVLSPNNQYLFVALGTGGIETLSFDSSTGALAQIHGIVAPLSNLNADLSIAISPNGNYLFVGETGVGGVRVFSVASNGVLQEIKGSPYSTGLAPKAILVDSTGSYVYVADRTANNISAFTLGSTGALTAISGSPFAAGTTPVALAEDSSDKYLAVVNAGGGPDLKLYSFSGTTSGALVPYATSATGTDPASASAIAATH